MSPDGSQLLFRRAGSQLDRRALRQFLSMLQDQIAGGRTFTCVVTDDRELRRLNREFLDKDYPTDVLSFPTGSGDTLGDIAISADRAAEQAIRYGHGPDDEVRILMLHGLLHLLGMDHDRDRGDMARTEKHWRRKLGLARGLIERARA
jgi:probable rRNA maturation factor